MSKASFTFNLAGPQPRDPVSIFHQGQAFFLAGNRCLLEVAVGPGMMQCLVSPGVVNLCFAIELFLKSLVVLAGGEPPKTHKLAELVALVPAAHLASVKEAYHRAVQQPDFETLLKEISDYFVKLRYGYEFGVFSFNEHPVSMLASALYVRSAEAHKTQAPVSNVRA